MRNRYSITRLEDSGLLDSTDFFILVSYSKSSSYLNEEQTTYKNRLNKRSFKELPKKG